MTDKDMSSACMSSNYFKPDGEYEKTKRNLEDIIFGIRQEYGGDIVYDTFRFNAFLMDYAPGMVRERKLIINALKEGILTQFRRGIDENEPIGEIMQRCKALLVSEMFITEEAAQYVVDVIAESMIPDISTYEKSSVGTLGEKQLIKGERTFDALVRKSDLYAYSSIGYKAFAFNRQLTEIDIPQNIKRIYPKAFKGCRALKTVRITRGTEEIGRNIFDGCTDLENIIIESNPYYTADNGFFIDKKNRVLMRYIYSKKRNISVVDGIKTIGRRSFDFCEAENVRISGSVEKIEEDAFCHTMNLKRIIADENNAFFRSFDGVLYSRDGKELLRYPQGKQDAACCLEYGTVKIGKKSFRDVMYLTSVTFTDTLMEIGESAFENCIGLESIILPKSVKLIGERAFRHCENVASVILPQGIVRIGDCAFQGCRNLRSISVPKSVREIGNMAFIGCTSLKKAVIQENVSFIGDGAFIGCPDIEVAVKNNEYAVMYCKAHRIKYTAI